jgi:hypothetical protein
MSNAAEGVNPIQSPGLEPDPAPRPAARQPWLERTRLIAVGTAVGGMILGALVGMAVQAGVESTGLLGPSVETLIAEQSSNFDAVNSRLDALQKLSSDPEVSRQLGDLAALIGRQNDLNRQATAELRYLEAQVADLREQQVAEAGHAGGADFWLKGGESVTVGSAGQVFAVIGARANLVDVNLSGTRTRMTVGDALSAANGPRPCTIFYKQATPRDDGRIGFDLDCS